MKGMRVACKTWQQGFELAVRSIRISFHDPNLPFGPGATRRFPGLTSLDIGCSAADESWLWTLPRLPKLEGLVMGKAALSTQSTLSRRLSDASLQDLCGLGLTSLDLTGCEKLTPEGLQCLRGLPGLTQLALKGCSHGAWADAGLESLRGLPMTSITLATPNNPDNANEEQAKLTEACLGSLGEMPLTSLALIRCNWLRNAGLVELCGKLSQLTCLDI